MIWPFKPKPSKQIARVEVKGAIGPGTRNRLLAVLKQVEEKKFPALLLRIDSPGGTVTDSHEIYHALKRLQEKVKIVASFGNISASGGVYISMGAPHIMSNPGTITGSVGVILRGNNIEKLLDRVGVSFKVIKSGPYKDILSFDRQLTPAEEQILQALIDSSYNQFTGDRLGTEEDARRWLAELAGLDPEKTKTYNFDESKSLLSRVSGGGDSRLAQSLLKAHPGVGAGLDWLAYELETSGLPLWLYRP
jgi:protease IV